MASGDERDALMGFADDAYVIAVHAPMDVDSSLAAGFSRVERECECDSLT